MTGSLDGQMSNILALGQTRNLGSRSNGSGREEVAGGGVGEVLEERGEGTQPRHRPSLEVVPHWVWQAGLIYNCSTNLSYTCIKQFLAPYTSYMFKSK